MEVLKMLVIVLAVIAAAACLIVAMLEHEAKKYWRREAMSNALIGDQALKQLDEMERRQRFDDQSA